MSNADWYHFEPIAEIDSPALVFYPERIKQNINILKGMTDDISGLRPHVKTHKTKEISLLMIQAGIEKFKCATIAEAEMLAACNAPDVLLAYQPAYPKLLRFIRLIKNYPQTRFSCLIDNYQSADFISAIAKENELIIPVYLDLNVGMNRTGIRPGREAAGLYEYADQLPNLDVRGLHAYDGHINQQNIEERRQLCNEAFVPVEKLRELLQQKGYKQPKLIAGGSPTFPVHIKRENTECSPGTFIFWDKGYHDAIPEQQFLYAALVLTRVISLPSSNTLCIDLGHKSIASENDIQHRVYFLNAPQLKAISHSEEHMVVEAGENHGFQAGDILVALPFHICPTIALYRNAVCIESNRISGSWEITARDRTIFY